MAKTQEASVATLLAYTAYETVTPKRFVGAEFFAGWDKNANARRELLGLTVETDGKPVKLKIQSLKESSPDAPIITELGEFPKALIPLPVWAALSRTRSFVGYVQLGETPWAVECSWDGNYRVVRAYSVEGPREWCEGRQFISLADS